MGGQCRVVPLKTSLHCGALVKLVAAVHYVYTREFHSSPILFCYIYWSLTVPLRMIEICLTVAWR